MGARRMSARKKEKRRAHKEKRLAQDQISTGKDNEERITNPPPRSGSSR